MSAQAAARARLDHVGHVTEKDTLEINKLEHVLDFEFDASKNRHR